MPTTTTTAAAAAAAAGGVPAERLLLAASAAQGLEIKGRVGAHPQTGLAFFLTFTNTVQTNCRTHQPIKLIRRFRDPIDRQNKECVKPI
jgi:hypothetical protein